MSVRLGEAAPIQSTGTVKMIMRAEIEVSIGDELTFSPRLDDYTVSSIEWEAFCTKYAGQKCRIMSFDIRLGHICEVMFEGGKGRRKAKKLILASDLIATKKYRPATQDSKDTPAT